MSSVLFDAPGPRARLRNHVISAVTVVVVVLAAWLVYSKLSAKGQLTAAKWEPFLTANLWKTYVLPGIQGTLTAAAISIVLAGILGVILGVGRMIPNAAVRWACSTFVEFFRAVPVLIMMIFAYFLYAQYDLFPPKHLALAGVVTGLTLYNSAVIAEILRAGITALPRGQSEAAASLGLRWGQTMRSILLPQAITSMLPVLISQLVVVLKDTAIGYQITYVEMVRQGTVVGSSYGNYVPALIVIALLMIAVNFTLSSLAVRLERRLRRSQRAPRPLGAAGRDSGRGCGAGRVGGQEADRAQQAADGDEREADDAGEVGAVDAGEQLDAGVLDAEAAGAVERAVTRHVGLGLGAAGLDDRRRVAAGLLLGHAAVGVERFRPNLVLEGLESHDEDRLPELVVALADDQEALLQLVKPCARCPIPNVDPLTALSSPQVGDMLQTYRQDARLDGACTFGMNAIVRSGVDCTLRVGQTVRGNYQF